MAAPLSRCKIAEYCAEALVSGTKTADLARSLAAYLLETRRTKELEAIMSDIEHQLVLRGIVMAELVSAHELTAETKQSVEKLIRQVTDASEIQLTTEINPEVLGGFKLSFAGSEIDATIDRKIKALKANL